MDNKMNTEPASKSSPIVQEIARSIYRIEIPLAEEGRSMLSHVNAYLIEGNDSWWLIDTGWYTPKALAALEAALKSLNLTFTDITSIIITHSHPDHFGMAGRIKHLSPKTEILMNRWESDLIESRYIRFAEPQEKMTELMESHGVPTSLLNDLESAFMPALEFVTVTLPDHILYTGEIIHTGSYDLEVIWTPGHSSGHICLYEPQNEFLFSGDHILPHISPNISYHILSGDNPLGDYIYSLKKLNNLPVKLILPAHEYPFTDLKGRIKAILEHHQGRENEIQQLIDNQLHTSYEIASQLKWKIPNLTWEQYPPMEKRMAVTETISHIEHMRWEGKIKKIIKNNHIYYSAL
jgi:glyoxylase-like metal-dependent hydrolase (beta-lactamase superfamily II)